MHFTKEQLKNFPTNNNLNSHGKFDKALKIALFILITTSITLFIIDKRSSVTALIQAPTAAFTISEFSHASILAKDKSKAAIQSILISDNSDSVGYVVANKKLISRKSPKIFTTVEIAAPKGKGVAKAIMVLPSGEIVGPVFSEITTKGDTMKGFYFSRTNAEWQPGHYVFIIRLSSGDTETVHAIVK